MRILLTVAYDGTNYCGWQRQENGATVQAALETAISKITGANTVVTGASRTDARVHALGQMVSFDADCLAVPVDKLPVVINNMLNGDIAVTDAKVVGDDFHPRFHAKRKTYEYKVLNTKYPNPMLRNYAWYVPCQLDLDKMQYEAENFIGTHDFTSFCASGSEAKSHVRTIYSVLLEKKDNLITFTVCGNGFLYNMIRIMIGTLIDIGMGKLPGVKDIIEAADRTLAGKTAPPQGLTLVEIEYNDTNSNDKHL